MAKVVLVELSAAERAKLSEKELMAYYAKTSHLGDIAFFLAHSNRLLANFCGVGPLMRDLQLRAPKMLKSKVQKEYRLLLGKYWQAVTDRERIGRAKIAA